MLQEFLTSNRQELIRRCLGKVSQRSSPPVSDSQIQYGVPLFLEQLVETLRCERGTPTPNVPLSQPWGETPASEEKRRTAVLHGKELLEAGYTVEELVHDYGDVCQAVTELAHELDAPVTIHEFHTLNRLLDNAIADAVSSYGHYRDSRAADPHGGLGTLADAQRSLIETMVVALDALKVGNVGLMGPTGAVLEDSLIKLRALVDKTPPEVRVSPRRTTPSDPEDPVKLVAASRSRR
jgi:hypothetical protein